MASIGRVERALAHQAVDAGFRAQEAECVFAFYLDGGGLYAGDFAVGFFQYFRLEVLAFAIAQILAQQHGGPVLGFCAAGAGLDVHEAIERVGGVGEHAPEFQIFQALAQRVGVMFDRRQGGVVVIGGGQFEEFLRVRQAFGDVRQGMDDAFQVFFLAAQILRVLGVVPDVGAFQLGVYDVQAFGFGIVVKDTSEGLPGAPRSLPGGRQVNFGVRLP